MDHEMLARVYGLVAEMEAIKIEVEELKRKWPTGGEWQFAAKAEELHGIATELQQLGRG